MIFTLGQRGRAGADGGAYRRLLAAGHRRRPRCACPRDRPPCSGIPNALLVWAVVGGATVFLLKRTTFGRAIYAIGNRERAAYLSGIKTQRVVLIAFALSGALSAFGGVLLAGYATKAYAGDGRSLPAAGDRRRGAGRHVDPRRTRHLSRHVAGVILITLLQSILSVMQMDESIRQIVYGLTIILMLLLYGRSAALRS
jgi:ribose transport system permease protein